jgi:hypothetical protein
MGGIGYEDKSFFKKGDRAGGGKPPKCSVCGHFTGHMFMVVGNWIVGS